MLVVFVLILVIGLILYFSLRSSEPQEISQMETYTPPSNPIIPNHVPLSLPTPDIDLESQIAKLRNRDSTFSIQEFEDLVSTAFFRVKRAWSKRDIANARAYLSDRVFTTLSGQIKPHIENNTYNKLRGLNTKNVEIISLKNSDTLDEITVLITAAAIDTVVDNNGKILEGNTAEMITRSELWKFSRSNRVETTQSGGLVNNCCPHCGASLAVDTNGVCEFCGSSVTEGNFDWVVTEITTL